jgi:hypothetical protein
MPLHDVPPGLRLKAAPAVLIPGSPSKAAVAQHLFEFLAGDLCDHLAPHRDAHTQRIKRAPVVNRVVTLMSYVKLRGLHPIDRVKSGL